jgi:hypothetical protein
MIIKERSPILGRCGGETTGTGVPALLWIEEVKLLA